jgi:hypothetical protein
MSARSRRRMSIRRRLANNSPSLDSTVHSNIHNDATANNDNSICDNSIDKSTIERFTPLRSSTVQSSRLGATKLGGAVRVDRSSASASEDSLSPVGNEVKKIKKIDLGYMMAWDPTKPMAGKKKDTNASSANTSNNSNVVVARKPLKAAMEIVEEEYADRNVRSGSIVAKETVRPPTPPRGKRGLRVLEGKSDAKKKENARESSASSSSSSHGAKEAAKVVDTAPSEPAPAGTVVSSNSAANSNTGDLHPTFLPLCSKTNLFHINTNVYAKLDIIGRGGSCKVYRALSSDFTVVALKRVKLDGMSTKEIEGYANEIALLKSLQGNPAIIDIYDSVVDLLKKEILIAMQIGDVDLNDVLKNMNNENKLKGESKGLNMNFVRLTWQQMLSCVHSIHESRIIHGDLKPANFLFVKGALKLIDFGIAKKVESDDTTNIYRENQVGTLNYMSPEAILDSGCTSSGKPKMRLGRASDVWSLGCILYQMCIGSTPFAKLHMVQKLQAIVNPEHKIYFPPGIDDAAIDAIQLCLRRKAGDRPPIVGKDGLLNEHWFLHADKT